MTMRKRNHTRHSTPQTLEHLWVDKKKTVVAVGLVAIMAIMWFRVLTGGKPKTAAAKPPATAPATTTTSAKLRFHDLPIIPGRNDRIDRNFFAIDDWNGFSREPNTRAASTGSEVHVVAPDRTREVIIRVAQRLKLEAVLESGKPQIFANNKLLYVGDTIPLKDGTDTYVFEVVQIEADSVLVRCREQELTLKLAQSTDVND